MKKLTRVLLLAFFLPSLSYANNSSFYGGLAYGVAKYEGKVNGGVLLAPNQHLKDDTGFVEIYAGYSLNEYISIEIGYADFDEVNGTYDLNPDVQSFVAPNNKEEIDLERMSVGGVIEYPNIERP